MTYSPGSSSGSQILTDDDDIFPAHINELRQSNQSSFVVGLTPNCQYYCDGVADDVQIQQALDDCETAGGGEVFIKEGSYDITAVLTVPSNTTVCGVGWKTILKASVSLSSIITNSDTTNGNTNIIINNKEFIYNIHLFVIWYIDLKFSLSLFIYVSVNIGTNKMSSA